MAWKYAKPVHKIYLLFPCKARNSQDMKYFAHTHTRVYYFSSLDKNARYPKYYGSIIIVFRSPSIVCTMR